ncbi:MAG: hypothetical protein JWR09_2653 [Mucilaginibacter sp.]|nr:hypothetical protein [Mucilaginibacter sp.]
MKQEKNLSTQRSIIIDASAAVIWDVLTNPEKIKLYLFGSNVHTDWKVGSPILFTRDRIHINAEPGKQPIVDKGQILEVEKEKLLKYTYYNSQEGYDDLPENYSIVTYTIERENDHQFKLTFLREKIPIAFEQMNQERFLPGMLQNMKNIAEQR